MNAIRKLTLLVGAAATALALSAGPVFAETEADAEVETQTEAGTGDDGHRTALADSPRDRLGLLLLGSLFVGGGLAYANARRQFKGERPQATGEFRWR